MLPRGGTSTSGTRPTPGSEVTSCSRQGSAKICEIEKLYIEDNELYVARLHARLVASQKDTEIRLSLLRGLSTENR